MLRSSSTKAIVGITPIRDGIPGHCEARKARPKCDYSSTNPVIHQRLWQHRPLHRARQAQACPYIRCGVLLSSVKPPGDFGRTRMVNGRPPMKPTPEFDPKAAAKKLLREGRSG